MIIKKDMRFFPDHQECAEEQEIQKITWNNNPDITNNRAILGDIVAVNNSQVVSIINRNPAILTVVLKTSGSKVVQMQKKKVPVYQAECLKSGYPIMHVASTVERGYDKYALVKFHQWTAEQEYPVFTCIQILGNAYDPEADRFALLYSNNLKFKAYKKMSLSVALSSASDRLDLTDKNVMSIDPQGCKDIDDAFHLEEDGTIGIHIADVTSQLPEELYNEVYRRCFSIYADNHTYHMLPEELSTNMLSLLPNKHRPALSIIIKDGKPELRETLICSKKALNYQQADKAIAKNDAMFNYLLDFFQVQPRNSHKLVENMMIYANRFVSELLDSRQQSFRRIQHTLMACAEYSTEPLSHAGLGLVSYTHFTSPIRRVADILVHRLLKNTCTHTQIAPLIPHINQVEQSVRKFYQEQSRLCLSESIDTELVISANIEEISKDNLGVIVSLIFNEKTLYLKVNIVPKKLQSLFAVAINEECINIQRTDTHQTATINIKQPVNLLISRKDSSIPRHRLNIVFSLVRELLASCSDNK